MLKWRNGNKPSEVSQRRPKTTTRPTTEIFPLTVDYDEKVEKLMEVGMETEMETESWDWSLDNEDWYRFLVSYRTNCTGKVETEAALVLFNRRITSEDAIAELDRMGLRVEEIRELLTFGIKYPDKPEEFPIVALGSRVTSSHTAPFIWLGRCELFLGPWDEPWDENCRFLAFRK